MGQVQPTQNDGKSFPPHHSTMYASNKRYEAIKAERDYYRDRALGILTATRKDAFFCGVVVTLACVFVAGCLGALFFWPA